MSSKYKILPRYLKTMHSRYYRLPKVLWDYIWRFDDRYRQQFKECIFDLHQYFNRNRIHDRIQGDIHLYNVYLYINSKRKIGPNIYGRPNNFAEYVLSKKKIFGDLVSNDNLEYTSLRKYNPPDPLQN